MGALAGALKHLVAASAPERADELVALDAAARAPLPLSTRVGVVATAGGSGCSVVAGILAATLAARRGGRVLAVNASAGGRSLLWHGGCAQPAASTAEQHAARRAARSSAQATAGLTRTSAGLYCLDLAEDGATAPDARWWLGVGPAGRFFDVVVTDHGARTPARSGPVAASASVVCVVTHAERSAWQHAVDLASAFMGAGVPAVLAVNAAGGRAPAWCRTAARLSAVPTVLVPHDRAHGAAEPAPRRDLRPATTLAALRLAATVLSAAAPSNAAGGGVPAAALSERAPLSRQGAPS
ncbi:hypothetical protein QUV83_05495 [Cellulomonas cellasea]|uniref:hypothetical protein n=1 Tax=Cellulomonas cellasea TaxID=43670 RepID=UPI0025A3D547|nr:hypothetical protein [Cellulomonas cellasea]MDM8084212.1 hypothetical protein [Cellulomonas cellasea]